MTRDQNTSPEPDIAECIGCGLKGTFDKFELQTEGDWESGYYEIHVCPQCEDGEIEYDMSPDRQKEFEDYMLKKRVVSDEEIS